MPSYVHKSVIRKPDPKKQRIALNFKVLPSELAEIRRKAKTFFNGNLTACVRVAIMAYEPSKKDLVLQEKAE